MTITHNQGSGKTVIRLTWTETRQFMDTNEARKRVAAGVARLVRGLGRLEQKQPKKGT